MPFQITCSPSSAFCNITCDDTEYNRLTELLKTCHRIFKIQEVFLSALVFLNLRDFLRFLSSSQSLLVQRDDLLKLYAEKLGLVPAKISLLKYQFYSNPLSRTTLESDFTLKMDHPISAIAISPCGQYIAAASELEFTCERTISIWHIKTGHCLHTIKAQSLKIVTEFDQFTAIAFSPDSKKIAFNELNSLFIFDLYTFQVKKLSNHLQHKDRLNCIYLITYWTPEKIITDCSKKYIKVWNAYAEKFEQKLLCDDRDINRFYLLPNNMIISSSYTGIIKKRDMVTNECFWTLNLSAYGNEIAVSSNQKYLVAGSQDGDLVVVDIERKVLLYQSKHIDPKIRHSSIRQIIISNNNQFFVSIAAKSLNICEISTGKLVDKKYFDTYITSACNVGEKFVMGFEDGSIQQFSVSYFALENVEQEENELNPRKKARLEM